ncbi:branched-chain amino acid transport system permease protein [Mesorhizobium albiziae]|uniref:Branched-chain amino acid transport system permease protein n=1 Tax=Neomesorhizobium albiziae TaxID=335020 RepID=A0A1I4EU01_9HYPH|nr:branched-chain amino acid ABC transporter permease [Mesorhizobium albiziae]GLS32677.1 branched-chain amino acid ABC transporter permease [Mesorhizobium albiziae]SFL09192.1 branched-chain amino acid transport system permease protein [Mesorhizobium albiziae]
MNDISETLQPSRPQVDVHPMGDSDLPVTARTTLGIVLACMLLAMAPWVLDLAALRFTTDFLVYLSLAVIWNLLGGYGGLISVGQQAYVGIGGYVFFVSLAFLGLPLPVAILAGMVVSAAAALVFAPLLLRLKGPHFAIGTWVMAELCMLAVANMPYLGGGSGMSLPASVAREIATDRAGREAVIFFCALLLAFSAIAGSYLLLRSKWGLALTALRDSERAAESLGVDTRMIKLAVFIGCSAMAGAVGCVVFLSKLRMTPDSAFSLIDWTAYVVFIVIIGGIGRIEGPIVGTIVFFALRGSLADLGPLYLIVLGLVAIFVMLKAPQGLWGLIAERYKIEIFPVQRRL